MSWHSCGFHLTNKIHPKNIVSNKVNPLKATALPGGSVTPTKKMYPAKPQKLLRNFVPWAAIKSPIGWPGLQFSLIPIRLDLKGLKGAYVFTGKNQVLPMMGPPWIATPRACPMNFKPVLISIGRLQNSDVAAHIVPLEGPISSRSARMFGQMLVLSGIRATAKIQCFTSI